MDYRSIFQEKDLIAWENVACSCFRRGGQVRLIRSDNYPMLFVLAGGVTLCGTGYAEKTFLSGDMVIVNRRKISAMRCYDGTILMESAFPDGVTERLEQHPTCFTQPFQPVVPITGRLESWVEAQFEPCSEVSHPQDEGLVELLVRYQSRRLKAICKIIKGYIELKES